MEKDLRQQKTNIIKIALFGPESTGKTTLAKQLADYYETEWVPEFARDYLQEKWEENETPHFCSIFQLFSTFFNFFQNFANFFRLNLLEFLKNSIDVVFIYTASSIRNNNRNVIIVFIYFNTY